MSVETLLGRLSGVRTTGQGKHIARCPAHDDRSPSLSLRECDDGRVLLHCFAGCEVEDVLSAVGMKFADIMPGTVGPEHTYKSINPRFDARQVLECLSHEVMVVCLLAERFAKPIDGEDHDRLVLAASRINAGLQSAPPLRTSLELKAIRRAG